MSYLPLAGVRVLDLGKMVGGDLATMRLADLGAEVVKVESLPDGDYVRRIPPMYGDQSYISWTLNRGKQSIALDLRDEAERETFLRLAAVADVLVEVSRPGSLQRLGVDVEQLRRARPELVVCSLTGFGQTGPLASLPSHGMSIDSLAACAPVVERAGRWYFDFTNAPIGHGLELGALNAALAITAAVLRARETGEGAWIDASFWDAGVEMRRDSLARLATSGGFFEGWTHVDDQAFYGIYLAGDGGRVVFCAQERKFWVAFCEGIGREDLVSSWQSEFAVADGPRWVRDELDKIFAGEPAQVWLDRFVAWGIPGGLVLEEADLPGFEHTKARGLIEDRWAGDLPKVLSPVRWMMDGSRPGEHSAPVSDIGADTDEVLARWLGDTSANS